MKKTLALTLMMLITSIFYQTAYANDAAEADMVRILSQTYDEDILMKGIQSALQDLSQKQLDAIIGQFEYGNILNGEQDLIDREWSPSEWANAISGGNNQRYKDLLESYQKAHPTLSISEANEGMSSENAEDYQQQVETNEAASTNATYAFNSSNTHLENIKKISEEINKTDSSKKIQDLNARMNAEIAYLQVEIIKGIAVMNEQMAQQQATEIHDRTEAAKFNKIPD